MASGRWKIQEAGKETINDRVRMTWRTCVEVVAGVGDGFLRHPSREEMIRKMYSTNERCNTARVWWLVQFKVRFILYDYDDDVETQSNVGRLFLELLFCREGGPEGFLIFLFSKEDTTFAIPLSCILFFLNWDLIREFSFFFTFQPFQGGPIFDTRTCRI